MVICESPFWLWFWLYFFCSHSSNWVLPQWLLCIVSFSKPVQLEQVNATLFQINLDSKIWLHEMYSTFSYFVQNSLVLRLTFLTLCTRYDSKVVISVENMQKWFFIFYKHSQVPTFWKYPSRKLSNETAARLSLHTGILTEASLKSFPQ